MSNMEYHFEPETRIYLRGHSNVLQVLEDTGFSGASNALGFVVPAPRREHLRQCDGDLAAPST